MISKCIGQVEMYVQSHQLEAFRSSGVLTMQYGCSVISEAADANMAQIFDLPLDNILTYIRILPGR